MSDFLAPNTADADLEVVNTETRSDGTSVVYVRSRSMASMAALAAFAAVLAPTMDTHSLPERPKRRTVSDFKPYPKLKGSLRNRPCPKCGRKLKVCACGLSPTPAARKVGGL